MGNPLVTIIIASYNSGKTIRRALDSVETQTLQDWECLIVDGASKDDTIDIVKEFAAQDARFRYISEPDKGIYDAFNKGWKNARGEWIYYLGSDDWLEPKGLQGLANEAERKFAIISGDTNLIRTDGSVRILLSGMPNLGCHQGMIMQRCIMEEMGGFDMKYKIIADYDLIVRILNRDKGMKIVHVVVANFQVGGTSQSLSNILTYSKERYEINKKFGMLKHPLISTVKTVLKKYGSVLIRNVIGRIK
ncbi:MAG: glycosyltransferase [Bacteroidaceae bacterium]|nr:glycosyltransferase [Bacteroidaceae bacterium]